MLSQLKSFLRKCKLPRQKKRCPHMAVAIRRWGPLRSWCRALRGRLSITYTHEPGQDGLATRSYFQSLVLTLDESEDAISPRERLKIRDAIELVLVALQTSPDEAWEQVVRVLCWTPDFYPANHLPTELEPRLVVRHVAYGTFQYDTLDVVTAMWASGARSGSYQRTRKWILENAKDSVTTKSVPLTLDITPTLVDMARGSAAYLKRALTMIKTMRSSNSVLRLEATALDLCALDIDASCCRTLRRLQQTGIRIDSLLLNPVRPQLLEITGGLVDVFNDTVNPLQKLVLDNSLGLAPASLWRALRHARALKEVEIIQSMKGSLPERNNVVQWQAYALLDPRSPTSITRVRFTEGSLSRADIALMNEVLTSSNPSEVLGLDEGELVPSRGPTKRLTFLQLMTSPATDDEVNDIVSLVHAVGRDLETFAWSVDRAEIKHHHLGAVFAACPDLRRLRLQRAQLQEVDGLLTHYETGRCRHLESLVLEDSVVLNRSSLLRFVTACNDPQTAVYRTLKDFAYDNYLHENVLAEMIPIIAKNTTLRHIGLRVTAFGMARHRAQLKQLHLAPLAMQHAPMPVDSKLAFLGAALGHLNSDVCHHIFAFAGEGVRRKVVCLVYDWIRLPSRFEL